jgi:hypothetical protein
MMVAGTWERTSAQEGYHGRGEHSIAPKEGVARRYRFICSPIIDGEDSTIQTLELVMDIADKKKATKGYLKELEEKNRELERMNSFL